MRDVVILFLDLIVTVVRLARPGGLRSDTQDHEMDYDKMKALMETSRKKSAGQREPEPKEFPKPASKPDGKYLSYPARERMAA